MRIIKYALLAALLTFIQGCEPDSPAGGEVVVPRGYVSELRLMVGGRQLHFGPFVGYYFRPADPNDLGQLHFICFNEGQFYTRDLPEGALLYEGDAVLTHLPSEEGKPVVGEGRIQPLFWDAVPPKWRATRPEPLEEYVHFHSCYDASGPVLTGYWLRHVAHARFTYDMGGRVGSDSVLYHQVVPGTDRHFAAIVEFDAGPRRGIEG